MFDRWVSPLSWLSFWSALTLAVFGAFGAAVWRARGRVVIEPFIEYNKSATAADSAGKPVASGLNDALVSELAALRELYRTVGERAEVDPAVSSSAAEPVDATLQLEDVSEFLQNASTGDATVSFGPLAVPIGTVMAMLGRLAKGPQLTGGLQVVATPEGDEDAPSGEVVLTAYYASADRLASWSVREPVPAYAASLLEQNGATSVVHTAAVRAMVEELASRIFTDLALPGTRSWRATRRFHEGLKQYRLARESQRDRVLKLRRAERAFIEALADDVDLPLARYNLGVVYRELHSEVPDEHFDEAAESAFLGELQRGQPGWQTYYALALTYFDSGRFADVSSLCDRAIELADSALQKAMALDLKGLADRNRVTPDEDWLTMAIESRRRAVAYALLALCDAELTLGDQKVARGVAAHCLLDLGIALAYAGEAQADGSAKSAGNRRKAFDSCRRLLSFAARLEDSFSVRLELGKIAFTYGEGEVAIRELRAAARIDPSSTICWAWLARVNAGLSAAAADAAARAEWGRRSEVAAALARSNLDLSDTTSSVEAATRLAEALEDLGDDDGAERARDIPYVMGDLAGETDIEELESRLDLETDRWLRGHIAWCIADLHYGQERMAEAALAYQRALDELRDEYPAEARRLGLQGMVAVAHAFQADPNASIQEALREVQEAIAIAPLSSWERQMLGRIREKVGDYESAIAAYEYALFWKPSSPDLHTLLGKAHLQLAEESFDAARRREAYRQATQHYESALALQSPSALNARAAAHFALGRAHQSADEYHRAVPHFRNAQALAASKPLAQLLLGEAYVRLKRYNEAEEVLSEAITAAESAAAQDPAGQIGNELNEIWGAADLAAQGHRLLALSFIERDVRLDEARGHIDGSKRLLDLLGGNADPSARASELELQGRIHLEEGKYDEAIASLNESVALAADVEAYLHLARAYRTKADASRRKEDRRHALQRARRACRHARDLDQSEMFQESIARVVAYLDMSTPSHAAENGQSPPAELDGEQSSHARDGREQTTS